MGFFLLSASQPEGIAVDPVARLLFYTDNGRDTINLAKLDGSDHRIIIQNSKDPRTIQVDTLHK